MSDLGSIDLDRPMLRNPDGSFSTQVVVWDEPGRDRPFITRAVSDGAKGLPEVTVRLAGGVEASGR